MHMRGTPRSMQGETDYVDLVGEIGAFLAERVAALQAAGVARERIVVDPGVGFGKTQAQNLELLSRQEELLALVGLPLLAGWSRKSTLAQLAGVSATPPAQRSAAQRATLDAASVAASLLAVQRGARIVRVHNVAAMVAALAVWKAAPGARG
jgi:dihydropteroate synthase